MNAIIEIRSLSLALGYLLLIIPIAIMLWYRVPGTKRVYAAIVRMTLQLLFVGLYLQVVFDLDKWWLTLLWLLAMAVAADMSVLKGAGLSLKIFFARALVGLISGATIPMAYFVLVILSVPGLLEPQYVIPITGMILGNCLRASMIGIGRFYRSIDDGQEEYLFALGQGASLREATRPFISRSMGEAMAPMVETIATIGLVSLPGMMTGILMAGVSPWAAIKYQIAIMIAIFTGTAITVALSIELSIPVAFTSYGILKDEVFNASARRIV
jgi:putative ABC transport system permease protein